MKKLVFSALLVLMVTSVANASPRFGVIGTTNQGYGLYVTDDVYTGSVVYASTNAASDEVSGVAISANYKIPVDNKTGMTVGFDYVILDDNGSEQNEIGVTVGIERAIATNLALIIKGNVYAANDDANTSSIFTGNGGVVGIAVLF